MFILSDGYIVTAHTELALRRTIKIGSRDPDQAYLKLFCNPRLSSTWYGLPVFIWSHRGPI